MGFKEVACPHKIKSLSLLEGQRPCHTNHNVIINTIIITVIIGGCGDRHWQEETFNGFF